MALISGRKHRGAGSKLSSFRNCLVVSLAATLLCACAATPKRVDFGGVMNPQTVPANAVSCEDHEWRDVERVSPKFPMDLVRFWYFRQDANNSISLEFNFDVDETGSPANIRFVEPEAYMRHTTLRKAILATAEALEQWRYHANGEAEYVTGCDMQMNYEYQVGDGY